jgi:Putative polyhydroxyalkanoic acid system protein (PHA_gran_rgn)
MSKLSMNIPHNLSKEEALTRIKGMLNNLKSQQADMISNVKEEWNNDEGTFAFTAKGFDLSGKIQVNDSSIDIDAQVPFAVSLFSGKIKSLISDQAKTVLTK